MNMNAHFLGQNKNFETPDYTFICSWCSGKYKVKDTNANDKFHYCSREHELEDERKE
jgi:hypothetical protein